MSIDERQLFLSNIAEQDLKDEAVIQLSKDRNAELRLRGVRLLIKRGYWIRSKPPSSPTTSPARFAPSW